MKKLIMLIFGTIFCLVLVACEKDDKADKKTAETTEATTVSTTMTTTTTTVTTTTAKKKTTAKTTEAPTEAETEAEEDYEEEEPEENYEEEVVEEAPAGGSFSDSDMYMYYGGSAFTVNQSISAFPAAISVDSSPSCYYDGDDKIFHYGDFDVYTYPSGGDDYVLEITLLSSGVSTSKGLTIGMSVDDAIGMYGEGTDGGSIRYWYSGNSYMYITSSGGVITSIGYALQN